jgi:sortase A
MRPAEMRPASTDSVRPVAETTTALVDTEPPPGASTEVEATGWRARRRAKRIAKWERPVDRSDWRYVVGTIGRILIATGLLLFGFVAYQLWGTGIETARAQRQLENEFEELLATAPVGTAPPVTAAPVTVPTTVPVTTPPDGTGAAAPTTAPAPTTVPDTAPAPVEQVLPPIAEGDPIARIEIPSIGVDDIVVAGVGKSDLQKGPGHFPDSPLPGQLGNAAIAGHRTTYGQPFRNIDDLQPGDQIVLTTLAGRFVYDVTDSEIVEAEDYYVVGTTDPSAAQVTLISCHPVYSAAQRIVVRGVLVAEESAPVGEPVIYGTAGTEVLPDEETTSTDEPVTADADPDAAPDAAAPLGSTPVDSVPAAEVDDDATAAPAEAADTAVDVSPATEEAFSQGWFDDEGAFGQLALWGAVVALISIGAFLLSRRFRRDLVGLVVGIVPFAIALFFFFQNVNRLLPPGL